MAKETATKKEQTSVIDTAILGLDIALELVKFVRTAGSLGDMTDEQIVQHWAKQRENIEELGDEWRALTEKPDPEDVEKPDPAET